MRLPTSPSLRLVQAGPTRNAERNPASDGTSKANSQSLCIYNIYIYIVDSVYDVLLCFYIAYLQIDVSFSYIPLRVYVLVSMYVVIYLHASYLEAPSVGVSRHCWCRACRETSHFHIY